MPRVITITRPRISPRIRGRVSSSCSLWSTGHLCSAGEERVERGTGLRRCRAEPLPRGLPGHGSAQDGAAAAAGRALGRKSIALEPSGITHNAGMQGEATSIKPAHALEKHFHAHKHGPLCHTSMTSLGTGQPKPELPERLKSCFVYSESKEASASVSL